MIEYAGFLYGFLKDLKKFLSFEEEDKLVEMSWLKKSGFGDAAQKSGFDLRWTKPEKIETRILDGYQTLYEIDDKARKKRRIVLKDGLVLMGKPK